MAKRELPSLSPFSRVRVALNDCRLPGLCLRTPADPFDFDRVDDRARRAIVRGLLGALFVKPRGVGLAAPMVGLGLRLIVADADEQTLVMANPEIVEVSDETSVETEGNLCLPGVRVSVERPVRARVRWQDMSRRDHEEEFEGWTARILQHEIEILDGRLFCDDLPESQIQVRAEPARHAAETVDALLGSPLQDRSAWPGVGLGTVTLPPDLLGLGGSVLTRPAAAIEFERVERDILGHLAALLFRIQHETIGVGFAAPQAGIGLRMAVVDDDEEALILLNPSVLESADETSITTEGCLSIPGRRGPVERPTRIRVLNHRITGEPYEFEAEGHHARVILHEIDHLDGTLYADRLASDGTLSVTAPEELARQAYQRTGM